MPGLILAALIAATARLIAGGLPAFLSEVLVAVLLGIVVANTVGLPPAAAPGIRFAVQRVLRLGIVLLGARLSLAAILAIGLDVLGLVVACMTLALAVALFAGRLFSLPPRLALLIGVGTAVCGNTAIVATAPVIKAEEREVSLAVAIITIFGTLAVFAYPFIGRALGLSDAEFGTWAGIAVNDTSQVVAASAAYSPPARDVATVVKLIRNALMAPLIVLIAWWWQRRAEVGDARKGIGKAVPLFVIGFIALAALRSAGIIDASVAALLDEIARACILVALAAVGLNTRLRDMLAIGPSPFYVGLGTAVLLAAVSLTAIVLR